MEKKEVYALVESSVDGAVSKLLSKFCTVVEFKSSRFR